MANERETISTLYPGLFAYLRSCTLSCAHPHTCKSTHGNSERYTREMLARRRCKFFTNICSLPLLLQLSYADTHPMFTTNSFPNFFRVVPSENALNAPRVALLLHFNWTRVGTIYQNEPRYSLVRRTYSDVFCRMIRNITFLG